MKRWLRRIGKVFLGLCLFWALVHVVEDWRGKRAWEAWQRDQIAKGAVYDPAQLQGPFIPDADNFAKAPCLEPALNGKGLWGDDALIPPQGTQPGWRTGRSLDLTPWAQANHTDDLTRALEKAAPVLTALADASRRRGCRFDLGQWPDHEIPLGILGLRSAGRMLNLRCLLELRGGKPDLALEDVLTQLRLVRHLASVPTLVVQLEQMAMTGIAMQGIWEGLETHAWNEAQLAELQEQLGQIDALTAFDGWADLERTSVDQAYEEMLQRPWWPKEKPFMDKLGSVTGHLILPQGWIRQNQLVSDIYFVETWQHAFDLQNHRVRPDRVRAVGTWWEQHHMAPYTVFAKEFAFAGPAIVSQFQRVAERQVALDEAFTTCALERYRLAHKAYPDSLNALVPAYTAKLPNDVFSGQPLHYRRDGDSFLLYSVGWNGTDEGGAMAMDGKDRDMMKGDWPWPRAAR